MKYGLQENGILIKNILLIAEAVIANLGIKKSREVGVKLDDLIVNCTFRKKICSMDQFHLFQHNRFYNCYTNDANVNDISVLTGREGGLSLILCKVCILTYIETQISIMVVANWFHS